MQCNTSVIVYLSIAAAALILSLLAMFKLSDSSKHFSIEWLLRNEVHHRPALKIITNNTPPPPALAKGVSSLSNDENNKHKLQAIHHVSIVLLPYKHHHPKLTPKQERALMQHVGVTDAFFIHIPDWRKSFHRELRRDMRRADLIREQWRLDIGYPKRRRKKK